MSLSKEAATAIVKVVSRDSESFNRINTFEGDAIMTRIVPDSWGITGDLRNWSLIAVGADPTEDAAANFVCVGIADASSAAISNALKNSANLPDVDSSETISRSKPAAHTATLVTMKDGSQYVFDWHKTLNVNNPFIFKVDDWNQNREGVMFTKFSGWQ